MNATASGFVVTGAGGFVGRALVPLLEGSVHALRLSAEDWPARLEAAPWRGRLVIHLSARVHEFGVEPEAYARDNAAKTVALARAAAAGGAARFVFLSSIKVNGESTGARAFAALDPPAPQDPYARSKREAESGLQQVAADTGLEVVTVRSPLVSGPGARGNLASLLRLCDTPWPLPLAGIRNRRALIDVEDLSRLLVLAATHAGAPGRTWLCAGPTAPSTPELVTAIREALGRPRRLFPFPSAMLRAGAAIVGEGPRMQRLLDSLDVDDSPTRTGLGWQPRVTLEASARKLVAGWRAAA